MDGLHWQDLYAKMPAISPSLLAVATLGGATQIELFLFLVMKPKVAEEVLFHVAVAGNNDIVIA